MEPIETFKQRQDARVSERELDGYPEDCECIS